MRSIYRPTIDQLGPYVNSKELVDVIGVVQNVSPTLSIRRKINSETIPKHDITIADETTLLLNPKRKKEYRHILTPSLKLKEKLKSSSGVNLDEEVSKLQSRRDKRKRDKPGLQMLMNEVTINLNVLCPFMKDRVMSNLSSTAVVTYEARTRLWRQHMGVEHVSDTDTQ
ncbi:hypothetical protein CsSME_00006679 [Camellia sinensis var. sinensis]